MTFENALRKLKEGHHMKRYGWSECRWVFLHYTTEETCSNDYLIMALPEGGFTPWLPNHEDLLSDDWEEA